MLKICEICAQPGLKSCAACQKVSYCSAEHQRLHWKSHKTDCCAFIIQEHEFMGRSAIAARAVKAGTIILQEQPIVFAPRCDTSDSDSKTNIPLCLGCCKLLPKENFRRCSKCRWPICSDICERSTHHAENECKIFAENVHYPPTTHNYHKGVAAIRACFLKNDPEKWKQLMALQHRFDIAPCCDNETNYQNQFTEFKVSGRFSWDDWVQVMNVLTLNELEFNEDASDEFVWRGGYVFNVGSMFNHSCAPNCNWTIVSSRLTIKTATDVKKGKHLTICYNDANYMLGTLERQKRIQRFNGFLCKCDRCKDSTEMGSNISTLNCSNCNQPTLVSDSPLDKHSSWTCTNCKTTSDAAFTHRVIDENRRVFAEYNFETGGITLFNKLKRSLAINVHPNHWIINEGAHKVIEYIEHCKKNNSKYELTDEEREIYLNAAEHLLIISSCVSPGFSRRNALLQYYIVKEKITKIEDDFVSGRTIHSQFKEEVDKVSVVVKFAHHFFKSECIQHGNESCPMVAFLDEQLGRIETLQVLALNEFVPVQLSPKPK